MKNKRPKQIAPHHLERQVVVYVRQARYPDADEERRIAAQRDQAEHARSWGWPEEFILVIDEDIGQAGSVTTVRSGFHRLCRMIEAGDVGIVLVSDLARLSRSPAQFGDFLSLCERKNVLVAVDGTLMGPGTMYFRESSPRQIGKNAASATSQRFRNGFRELLSEYESEIRKWRSTRIRSSEISSAQLDDPTDRFRARLGTLIAEHENALRRQYLMAATRLKARNGHAVRRPPTGYVGDRAGRWRMDPDPVVREIITGLFTDFERLGSIGKVLAHYRKTGIRLPVRNTDLVWREPSRGRIRAILMHPSFKGDYIFGRRVTTEGRTRRQPDADEMSVVPNHHEAYISPERWERIQAQMRRNGRSGR